MEIKEKDWPSPFKSSPSISNTTHKHTKQKGPSHKRHNTTTQPANKIPRPFTSCNAEQKEEDEDEEEKNLRAERVQ